MHDGGATQPGSTIGDVVDQLQQRLDALSHDQVHRRIFIKTYQRTTQAVGDAVDAAFFEDPEWVVRWDVAFAHLFIVFDPELFMSTGQFTVELEELLMKIKNLPRQPGVSEIRIPSERGFREREIRRQQGILVNKLVVERLRQMS